MKKTANFLDALNALKKPEQIQRKENLSGSEKLKIQISLLKEPTSGPVKKVEPAKPVQTKIEAPKQKPMFQVQDKSLKSDNDSKKPFTSPFVGAQAKKGPSTPPKQQEIKKGPPSPPAPSASKIVAQPAPPAPSAPKIVAPPAPPAPSAPKVVAPPVPPAPKVVAPPPSSVPSAPMMSAPAGGMKMAPPPPPPPMGSMKPPAPPPLPKNNGKGLPPPPTLPKNAVAPNAIPMMGRDGGNGDAAMMAQSIPSDPEEAKKQELENNPDFKKYLKVLKMGVTAHQVRIKMSQEGKFDPDELMRFLDYGQIMQLRKIGNYKGDKY